MSRQQGTHLTMLRARARRPVDKYSRTSEKRAETLDREAGLRDTGDMALDNVIQFPVGGRMSLLDEVQVPGSLDDLEGPDERDLHDIEEADLLHPDDLLYEPDFDDYPYGPEDYDYY